MELATRTATVQDIERLSDLYHTMEEEQIVRKPIWAFTDGLDTRFENSFAEAIEDDNVFLLVGTINNAVVGFVWATVVSMLNRAGESEMGRIRLIYTEPDARGVGVGHRMLSDMLDLLRDIGVRHFDAPVGPGQRAAKNFFEGHMFAARSIIMHSADEPLLSDD